MGFIPSYFFHLALIVIYVLSVLFDVKIIKSIVGFVILGYIPGDLFIRLLFRQGSGLDTSERRILTIATSLMISIFLGLLLNLLPQGLIPGTIILAVLSLTMILLSMNIVLDMVKPVRRIPESYDLNSIMKFILGDKKKSVSFVRIAIISVAILCISLIGYLAVNAKNGEKFTEFYLLDGTGLSEDYPRLVETDSPITLMAGVTNREQSQAVYAIIVRSGEQTLAVTQPFPLTKGETWEGTLTFSLPAVQKNQLVEILLLRSGQPFPYRTLHLWLDVAPAP